MIAYDQYHTGFFPSVRRVRALRHAGQLTHATVERQGPAARVAPALPTGSAAAPFLAPSGDGRLLRRLRHVVRRRIRVDLDGLVGATVTDGELTLRIDTLSARDPRTTDYVNGRFG